MFKSNHKKLLVTGLFTVIFSPNLYALAIPAPTVDLGKEILDDYTDQPGFPDILSVYATRVEAYYASQQTTLYNTLSRQFPFFSIYKAEYLKQDQVDVTQPLGILRELIDGDVEDFNNWQKSDMQLRNAGLTLENFVRTNYPSVYADIVSEKEALPAN